MLDQWIPLNGKKKGTFKVLMTTNGKINAGVIFSEDITDLRILNSVLELQEQVFAMHAIIEVRLVTISGVAGLLVLAEALELRRNSSRFIWQDQLYH